MAIQLNAIQRRVLGVLMEKQMTTPRSYPLTLNTIVTGCNQLTCRDPVMRLSEGEVARVVHELQQLQLVTQAEPDRNSRSNRFRHCVEERFGWSARERALMTELLLRGPQTIGELKGNASRMTPLEDSHYVGELLAALASREPAFVVELPRQPGRSVSRFDHRFYTDEESREQATAQAAAPPPPPAAAAAAPDLETRVDRLEAEVRALREQVYALRTKLGEG